MKKTNVSVIIAVRNGERFLSEALKSVLEQEYLPDEIIVIDGNSTDKTAQIARSYTDVSCVRQKNKGISDAYNLGIKTAKGKFIAFLSHDDLWTQDKLSTQLKYMEQHPDLQFTIAYFKYFLEKGCQPPPGFRKTLLNGSHIGRIMETLVARREVFDRVGFFDTTLSTAEDVDWFSRTSDMKTAMAVLPNLLLNKRVHDKNISLNVEKNNINLLKALRKSVQRKKQAANNMK